MPSPSPATFGKEEEEELEEQEEEAGERVSTRTLWFQNETEAEYRTCPDPTRLRSVFKNEARVHESTVS